jgi:hypothetical protein
MVEDIDRSFSRKSEMPKSTLRICRKEIAELMSKLQKNHESEDEKEILSRAKIWKDVTQKSHWPKLNQGLDVSEDVEKIIFEAQIIIRDYNLSR